MAHAGLGLIIDRDLHRASGDGGEVDGDRLRPSKPDEAATITNADDEGPSCSFHPNRAHGFNLAS